ncbi:GNAT family N-acetyltransferase [Halovulum dunhuangense]|uniref:GNAT family N-acetyltransferase n=1 Tax=Halovulum dunhuangense TaxID=1505036 RepID=A0A849L4E2_9RHOB|nr:GNAT family N-acetyltransferase [Halovulum dunhuangense]
MAPARADFAEWPALLDLLRRSFAYMEGRVDPPSSLGRMDAECLRGLAAAGDLVLSRDGSQVVGCAFCTPKPTALYIGKVATDAAHRRRGIARALMAAADDIARGRGLPALELQVRIELHEVQAAYDAMGFMQVGTASHPGYDRPTSLILRRSLSTP